MSESTHEQSSVMATTLKMGAVYSPALDSARYMGKKAAMVVSEEMRSGILSSFPESTAASMAPFPSAICTMMDSDTTIALSTSIPRAMMRAARDI